MNTKERMRINLPKQHSFLETLRYKSLIIEYLLDKEFGTDFSRDPVENNKIQARKIVRAQEIIALMQKRSATDDEPPDKDRA